MSRQAAFQSILFPVDFSQASEITARYAHGLAQHTGATVTLLHVLPWLSGWYGVTELRPPVAGDEGLRVLLERQRVALAAFRAKHFRDLNCFSYIEEGSVAETIVDIAQESGADLIMMPTRGLGPSRRFLIGSTTAKVLHDARCAIWTTPHLHELQPFTGFRHLLCTIDRDEVLPDFLKEVVRLASCFGSKLSFVTAVPSTVGGTGDERRIETLTKEYPQAGLQEDLGQGLDCTVYVETGPVGQVVRRLVEQHNVDLVVTNRGHLQHPFGKLQTHAYEIVLESPCPVLSLSMTAKRSSEVAEHAALQTV